jgi:hypothetical protein
LLDVVSQLRIVFRLVGVGMLARHLHAVPRVDRARIEQAGDEKSTSLSSE